MSSTRKALAFSFLDRYAGLTLAIVSSMVIARLLTPAEIGIFSVTMVLLSLASSMRDMGAGQYLVQEKELTPDRIRATWTVQMGLGCFLALVGLAAAYPVSLFYKEPKIFDIMLVLSLNFAISPFGSLTYAWLMRQMRFDQLAIMRFSSALTGAIAGVFFAWRGYGALSLAFGSLTTTLTNVGMSTFFRPKHFPLRPGFREIRRVLSFGSQISLTTLMNAAANSVAELVLGKVHGMASAGLFSRANGLASMFQKLFMDATQSVVLPLLSREARETGTVARSYIRATAYVTVVGWSFFMGVILMANPIVRLLYGPQWDLSAELTRVLSVGLMLGLMISFCSPALIATGGIRLVTKATLISVVEYGALCAIGAWFGLWPLAFCTVAGAAISVVAWLVITQGHTRFAWGEYLGACTKSASVAVIAGAVPFAAVLVFGARPASIVPTLALGIPGGTLMFILGVFVVNHPIKEELLRAREMIGRKWAGA